MTIPPTLESLSREVAQLLDTLPAAQALPGHRIGLYGTGFLGSWAVDHLRNMGAEPLVCFDGDPHKHGTTFKDIDVCAFPDPASGPLDGVLITARHAVQSIAPLLERQGVKSASFDGWYVANHFAKFIELHDHFFSDERSRQTLRAVLHTMLTGDRRPLGDILERDQYFCLPQFTGAGRERYVDAGAYVGDSVERFIWANAGVFKKIWAFEPFTRQCAALRKRTARLTDEWALDNDRIAIHQAGLGARTGRMWATTSSGQLQSTALVEDDHGDIAMVALDDLLDGEAVTFIKADVEGMEMDLLAGAQRTISACKPKLAICVYHYPSDIPEIAARIRAYVPEYQFALRHHSPQLMETVLYGWID